MACAGWDEQQRVWESAKAVKEIVRPLKRPMKVKAARVWVSVVAAVEAEQKMKMKRRQ
jgi:hypothetical protein